VCAGPTPSPGQSNGPGAPSLTVLDGGGASNSRPTATSCRPGAAGFDTVRVRLRDQDGAYDRARGSGAALQARGELRLTRGGVTVGAYPDGLVTVEGRLAALLHGEDDHRLLGPEALNDAPAAAAELFGGDPRGAAIGRADLASELHFGDGREGLSLLHAASRVDLPWLKSGSEGVKGQRVETVAWRTVQGRSVVLRLYDKGVETGQAEPGEWVRLERQRRYRKDRERTVAQLLAVPLAETFAGRELSSIVEAGTVVSVCDQVSAVECIRLAVARGEVSRSLAGSLVGFIHLGAKGVPPRTVRYWASALRRLGVAFDPNIGGRDVVPIGDYLGRFSEAWAA
jgi:hypothetical protein